MTQKVGIVGASMAGLSVANVLYRHGFNVTVLEAFGHGFETRGGALGFADYDIINQIRYGKEQVEASNNKLKHPGMGSFYGTIWKFLYEGLPEGTVRFNAPVKDIVDGDTAQPKLLLEDGTLHSCDFVIGADGGKSVVRKHVIGDEQPAEGTYAGYVVWRGLIQASEIDRPPRGVAKLGDYRYETLGFPCRNQDNELLWNCGIYMPLSQEYVSKSLSKNRQVVSTNDKNNTVPEWFLPLVQRLFPNDDATNFWTTCLAKGKVSQHPIWEFAANNVVNNNHRLLIVGDAAHMISPRTGSGAYSAMLDALALEKALQETKDLQKALALYAPNGKERAQHFLRLSQSKKTQFMPLDQFHAPHPQDLLRPDNEVTTSSVNALELRPHLAKFTENN